LIALPPELYELHRDQVPLADHNMVGVTALRDLLAPMPQAAARADVVHRPDVPPAMADLATLVDQLADHDHGLVMCMGKGGVGKTTIAAAIATALADRGKSVHLTTTDPAAHLVDTLGDDTGTLTVSRIDPEQATQDYRQHVMTSKGAKLDDAGRAALAEDLRSPCTEEVAVFQAFSRAVAEAGRRFVVMDTAPTGHTVLLMDATGSYHREIARNMAQGMHFTTPMMRLQDPDYTQVILVTLPETTPVLEARQLQDDLKRADIHPWAWVVNQTLTGTHTDSPMLVTRAHHEAHQLANIVTQSSRVALVPLQQQPPVGREQLLGLTRSLAHA
jgi:arsenite/tail-anchored protein-transporting ATPase